MAAYASHAWVLGYKNEEVNRFFGKALFAIGEDWGMEELLPIVMEVGEKNLLCMEMLDKANTETYGTPAPTAVPLKVEKGPFIIVTGHDLRDLKMLLERVCFCSGAHSLYHELSDAGETDLCRQSVYHRRSGISGNASH